MKFCDKRIQEHLLKGGKIRRVSNEDLIADDWEIVEPGYDWDKIIKENTLCIFSDYKTFEVGIIATLREKTDNKYCTDNYIWYKYCKPYNYTEVNITKKEYEK